MESKWISNPAANFARRLIPEAGRALSLSDCRVNKEAGRARESLSLLEWRRKKGGRREKEEGKGGEGRKERRREDGGGKGIEEEEEGKGKNTLKRKCSRQQRLYWGRQ